MRRKTFRKQSPEQLGCSMQQKMEDRKGKVATQFQLCPEVALSLEHIKNSSPKELLSGGTVFPDSF